MTAKPDCDDPCVLEKPFPDKPIYQQPLEFRRAYQRAAARRSRAKAHQVQNSEPQDDSSEDHNLIPSYNSASAELRKQYNREIKRKSRAKLKLSLKAPKQRVCDLPRKELLARRRKQKQQLRAAAKARINQMRMQNAAHLPIKVLQRATRPKKVARSKAKSKSPQTPPDATAFQKQDPGDGMTYLDAQTNEPILQIFGANDPKRRKRLGALELEGEALFNPLWDHFVALKSESDTAKKPSKSVQTKGKNVKRGALHPAFGIWHTPGNTYFGFTSMSVLHRDLTIQLLDWTRRYTIAGLRYQKIHPIFHKQLLARKRVRPHLRTCFGDDAKLLHSFWSTVFLFKNAKNRTHSDFSDDNPSLLFNFGEEAWLALPDFETKVLLRPLDVAIFASSRYRHFSVLDTAYHTHVEGEQKRKRWAVGGFMRKSVLRKAPVHTFAAERKSAAIATRTNLL